MKAGDFDERVQPLLAFQRDMGPAACAHGIREPGEQLLGSQKGRAERLVGTLDPAGHVDGVSDHRELAPGRMPERADDQRAEVCADAYAQLDPELLPDLPVEGLQGVHHPEPGADGAQAALFRRCPGQSEQSDDLVADVLVDEPAVEQDRLAQLGEEPVQDVEDVVREVALHERRELPDVAHEDGGGYFSPRAGSQRLDLQQGDVDGGADQPLDAYVAGSVRLAGQSRVIVPPALPCDLGFTRLAFRDVVDSVEHADAARRAAALAAALPEVGEAGGHGDVQDAGCGVRHRDRAVLVVKRDGHGWSGMTLVEG